VTRRQARELALQTLFSIDIGKHDPQAALDDALTRPGAGDERAFVRDLVLGTLDHAAQSDEIVTPLLQDWTLDRIPTVDRLILRMAVYEMQHCPETPRVVAINEAIELAKKFSTEDSGRFVNGVLSNVGAAA
jgi:N utilization substance protein B